MVNVTFIITKEGINGFCIEGHAGAGKYGQDIVCSAISSPVYMVSNTITEVMKVPCNITVKDGYFSLQIPELNMEECQVIMKGLELHMRQLEEQYPKNLKIIYGGVSNA